MDGCDEPPGKRRKRFIGTGFSATEKIVEVAKRYLEMLPERQVESFVQGVTELFKESTNFFQLFLRDVKKLMLVGKKIVNRQLFQLESLVSH